MRYIDLSLIDVADPDVVRWLQKATEKSIRLSELQTHDEKKSFFNDNNIWKDFKPILIRLYGEKCWYSECDLTGSFGDVDHFRPKGKSTDENNNIILEDGYWWLAYDYQNYRLSCEKCNRLFGKGGKRDKFPLMPGTIPASPNSNNDIPLLLDPCSLHDVQLIDCDESGEIIPLSRNEYEIKRVTISKIIYNWNCFNTARKGIRNQCKIALEIFELLYESAPHRIKEPLLQIERLTNNKTPYSSFAKKYIKNKIEGKPYYDVLLPLVN